MGGLEILSTSKFQVADTDQKPQQPRTPSKYMETSSSRATFIRQLVRTMSLEDILADEEVCDILSDSPDPEEDDDYEEPLDPNLIQQHVSKLLEDELVLSAKSASSAPFNYFSNGSRHVLTASPTHCYTVDMATGVASPIKTTSNVDIGKSKLRNIVSLKTTGQGDVVQQAKRLPKETDQKVDLIKKTAPAILSQSIKGLQFDAESHDDRGSSVDDRERLGEKDLIYQSVYSVDRLTEESGEAALHNGLLQSGDLGVHVNDLRESYNVARTMRTSEPVSMLRGQPQASVSHLAPPPINMPQHPHMHQLDGVLQNGPVANSKSYKVPMHGSSSVYKPMGQPQPAMTSTHTYTQAYSYSHNVQYGPTAAFNESYNSYNNPYNASGSYNGGAYTHQSSMYQYSTPEQQHFPNYPPPSHPAPYQPYQAHQNAYTPQPPHVRPTINNTNSYNLQQPAYPNNMYGYNNYNAPPKQVTGFNHAVHPPAAHRQQTQAHPVHTATQQYAQVPNVQQPSQDKSRAFHTPSFQPQPRPTLAPAPPQLQQPSFHPASSHFAPLQSQQPEHDHHHSSEGYEGYSSGSDEIEGGDECKGSKRSELVESPTTKQTYKQFFKQFKATEKEGLSAAKDFAEQNLELLPLKVHWKVYLELADLAKRENSLKLARKFYRKVIKLQPYASQGWLEYAKMEEECGQLDKCAEILTAGLSYCPYNESLMVKGIKHEERMGNLAAARSLLSRLRNQSIDKAWRTIMEGGLLEARAGNVAVARKIFKYLIKNVPWYGPIYQEAYRFEEKCEEYDRAIAIVEKGLKENPRYGPLWFSALRLYEKTSNGNLQTTRNVVERAAQSISKELMWKIYFEAAQIEERAGNLDMSRAAYVKSVEHCPENLLWKVWLGGSRTELDHDNVTVARKLLMRSLKEVPTKMRAMVLLECSRLEEFAGNVDKARRILQKAKHEAKHEWKVFLESVLLEMRANNIDGAIVEAKEALKIHSGTGRLWAVLIQLKQGKGQGFREQLKVFQRALREVPKSGEVWCEGARIALNNNEIAEARRFLDFAIQFTPQYGDSFIEYMRLELMQNGENADTTKLEQSCVNADPNYGTMWLHSKKHPLDSTRQVLRNAKKLLNESSSAPIIDFEKWDGCWVGSLGILSLSRVNRNTTELTNEERRKLIFGSDQIKP